MSLLSFSDWVAHPRARASLHADVPRCLEPDPTTGDPARWRDFAGDAYRCLALDEGKNLSVAVLAGSSGRHGWTGLPDEVEETEKVWVVGPREVFAVDATGQPVDSGVQVRVERAGGKKESVRVLRTWAGTSELDGLADPFGAGDRVVSLTHVPGPTLLYWTRDEPGRARVGYSTREGIATFLPGGTVRLLGPGTSGARYPLPNRAPTWASGRLAGDPARPDLPAFFRVGDAPGEAARPVVAGLADDGTSELLVRGSEVHVLRDLGGPLWHWTWDLGEAGAAPVGPDRVYLSPIPERSEVPLLCVGEGRFLSCSTYPTEREAESAARHLPSGRAAVALSTGLALPAAVDSHRLRGRTLRYLGVALGTAQLRRPAQLLPTTPMTVPRGRTTQPDHRGVSGWVDLPDGSGAEPRDDGGGRVGVVRASSDGVGRAWVLLGGGVALPVSDVANDNDLPPLAPPGTAVFSRGSSLIVLDRPTPPGAPPWFQQETFVLGRGGTGAWLATARKGPFEVRGTESLWVKTPGGVSEWKAGAIPAGWYQADKLAPLLQAAAGDKVRVRADRGVVLVEDPAGQSVEILPGPPGGPFDFSGCQALGLAPGWRRSASGQDWVVDPGLAAGSLAPPLPSDTDGAGERVLADPLGPFPVLSLPSVPWDDDGRLPGGNGVRVDPPGTADPVPVRIGLDAVIDPAAQTLSWVEPAPGDPVPGPVFADDGGIFLGRRVEILDPGTAQWRSAGPDEVVRQGGQLRLAQASPGLRWSGVVDVRAGQFDAPAVLDGVDLVEVDGRGWFAATCEATHCALDRAVDAPRAVVRAYQPGGWALSGVQVALQLREDEGIQVDCWVPDGEVYRREEMTRRVDYSLEPSSGRIGFPQPLAPRSRVHVTYWRATPRGQRLGTQAEQDFARFYVDKIAAQETNPGYFVFGTGVGQPPVDLERAVTILAQDPQGVVQASRPAVSFPPDQPGTGVIRANVPQGSVFQVSYFSVEALGGDTVADIPRPPVYLPWLRVPAGTTSLVLRGDRTDQFAPGKLLRVGAECFWVGAVRYSPAPEDTTEVSLGPPAEVDAGAPQPGGDTLFLLSDRPLQEGAWEWVGADVLDGAVKGSATLRVRGPSWFVPQAGTVADLGGCPSAVAAVAPGPEGSFDLTLTTPLRPGAGGQQKARLLRAPLGLDGTSQAPGNGSLEVSPGSLTGIRWDGPGPGTPSPGVQVDPATGNLVLAEPASPGTRLALVGWRLRPADGAQVRVLGLRHGGPPGPGALRGTYLSSGRDYFVSTLSGAAPAELAPLGASPRELLRRDARLRKLLSGATVAGWVLARAAGGGREPLDLYQETDPGLPSPGCLDEVTGRVVPRLVGAQDPPFSASSELDDLAESSWTGERLPLWRGGERSRVASRRVRWAGEVRVPSWPPGWVPTGWVPVAQLRPDHPAPGASPPRVLRIAAPGCPVGVYPDGVKCSDPDAPTQWPALAGQVAWVRSGDLMAPLSDLSDLPLSFGPDAGEPTSLRDSAGQSVAAGSAWAAGFPLTYLASQHRVTLLTPPVIASGEGDGVLVRPDGRVEVAGGSRAASAIRAGTLIEGYTDAEAGIDAAFLRSARRDPRPRGELHLLRDLLSPASPKAARADVSGRISVEFPLSVAADEKGLLVTRSSLQWDERGGRGFVFSSVREAVRGGPGGWYFSYETAEPLGDLVRLAGVTAVSRLDGRASALGEIAPGLPATGSGSWLVVPPPGCGAVSKLTLRVSWSAKEVCVSDDPDQISADLVPGDPEGAVHLRFHLPDAQWRILYHHNRPTPSFLCRNLMPGLEGSVTWSPVPGARSVHAARRQRVLRDLAEDLLDRVVRVRSAAPGPDGCVELRIEIPEGPVTRLGGGWGLPAGRVATGNWMEIGGALGCVVRGGTSSDAPVRVRPVGPPDPFLQAARQYGRVVPARSSSWDLGVCKLLEVLAEAGADGLPGRTELAKLAGREFDSGMAIRDAVARALLGEDLDLVAVADRVRWLEDPAGLARRAPALLDLLGEEASRWVRWRAEAPLGTLWRRGS